MPGTEKSQDAVSVQEQGRRKNLPPKGTAERLLRASGLWSDMSPDEIENLKKDIFGSRRSSLQK